MLSNMLAFLAGYAVYAGWQFCLDKLAMVSCYAD
jgi:hypothetical protein